MGLMNAFDSQTEDSSPAIGRNLRSRPLARKKLSEMVEEELEQMIRRREFGEGEQLPSERELMAFFNVGRPSVREALAALKRKGLVQINNGERARVSTSFCGHHHRRAFRHGERFPFSSWWDCPFRTITSVL